VNHEPKHPAGNWFPRGAYGLPIQTEFKNAKGDPYGKFFLLPQGKERWPSPVILKVIKLGPEHLLRTCLILNQALPEELELKQDQHRIHTLRETEKPLACKDKEMPDAAEMLKSGENPYDALVRHLNLKEVCR
jgi:CRISPR-associated protein Cmr1